ncbi:MAG: hypothetical protein R3F60_18280 [bacterium]
MPPTCIAPHALIARLGPTTRQAGLGPLLDAAHRAFMVQAGPTPADDPFFQLWAACDFGACPPLGQRLLDRADLPAAFAAELRLILPTTARLFVVDADRTLCDALTGTPWRSALGRLVSRGGLIYARLAGPPAHPWPIGPIAAFPPESRSAVWAWLHARAAQTPEAAPEAVYRRVAPSLYRWWRAQRAASAAARGDQRSSSASRSDSSSGLVSRGFL